MPPKLTLYRPDAPPKKCLCPICMLQKGRLEGFTLGALVGIFLGGTVAFITCILSR